MNSKPFLHLFLAALGLCMALPGSSVAAPPDFTLDLATVPTDDNRLRRIHGSGGSGSFGLPVAGGFDVDGDGHGDYAVGYLTFDALGRNFAGEVDLVFGNGTISGTVDTAVVSAEILRFAGAGVSETAGSEIWMDDVTGDGLGDLLICRQNHTPEPGRIGAGALTIVVGGAALRTHAATLATVDLAAPPVELTLTTLVGAEALDRLCIWARTGDVDGDGIADIAVGADQVGEFDSPHEGALFVIRGGGHLASGGVVDLADFGSTPLAGHLAKITPPPGSMGYHFGGTCQVGDLDGNGRAEVLAAATLNRAGAAIRADGADPGSAHGSGGAPEGTVFIAWDDNFPQEPWVAGYAFDISAAPGSHTSINGEAVNDHFGEEILGGLDYNGDGMADLFIGDLLADGTLDQSRPSSGLGHVFFTAADLKGLDFDMDSPPPGLNISRILGPNNGAFGADTAAHGDFDGDLRADLAFASPHAHPQGRDNAGAVHFLFGQDGSWPAVVDLSPGNFPAAEELRVTEVQGAQGTIGSDSGDTLGYSASFGDVNGDGAMDLLVNEMVGNGVAPGTEDVGNLILLNGRALTGAWIFSDGFESGDTSAWGVDN